MDSFYIVLLLPSISKVKKYFDLKNVSVEKIPLAASEVIEVKKSKDIHFFHLFLQVVTIIHYLLIFDSMKILH